MKTYAGFISLHVPNGRGKEFEIGRTQDILLEFCYLLNSCIVTKANIFSYITTGVIDLTFIHHTFVAVVRSKLGKKIKFFTTS